MAEPFIWPVRVYYEDTDFGGLVYNANYLKYMERARSELLRHLGVDQVVLKERHNKIFVVTDIEIKFQKPGRFDDELLATAEIVSQSRVKMIFQQDVLRGGLEGERLTSARVGAACLDAETLRPQRLPKSLQELIQ
ncbi:MAG: tol-pal system-associated acyl-CoA thioesterase [Pseudomonadota bacterium]